MWIPLLVLLEKLPRLKHDYDLLVHGVLAMMGPVDVECNNLLSRMENSSSLRAPLAAALHVPPCGCRLKCPLMGKGVFLPKKGVFFAKKGAFLPKRILTAKPRNSYRQTLDFFCPKFGQHGGQKTARRFFAKLLGNIGPRAGLQGFFGPIQQPLFPQFSPFPLISPLFLPFSPPFFSSRPSFAHLSLPPSPPVFPLFSFPPFPPL